MVGLAIRAKPTLCKHIATHKGQKHSPNRQVQDSREFIIESFIKNERDLRSVDWGKFTP
jgi:hypothetical protein